MIKIIQEQLSDIDGLLNAVNDVSKDVDQDKYQEAINYFNGQMGELPFEDYE